MIIQRLDFRDYVFDFVDGGYTMSYVTMKNVRIRVLRLQTRDGSVGWGEIVRKPSLDASRIAPLELPLLNSVAGQPLKKLDTLIHDLQSGDPDFRGLAFGLDTAHLDLTARRASQPLYTLLGGRKNNSVPDYFSFSCASLSEFRTSFVNESSEHSVIQIKLGSNNIDEDYKQVKFALEHIGKGQTLLADFNGALTTNAAESFIQQFNNQNIIWEEPCNTADENIEVANRTGKRVMFDQCLNNLTVIKHVLTSQAAHSLVIKPALLGGLTIGQAARNLCAQAKYPMRMDGPWSGEIASSALMHLTVGTPPELLISGGNLTQKLLVPEPWGGIEKLKGGRIAPAPGIGHGSEPISF